MPYYDTELVASLQRHADCTVRISAYGGTSSAEDDNEDPPAENAVVECVDHGEVLVDAEPDCHMPPQFATDDPNESNSSDLDQYADETPSQNVLVTAQAPMNILREDSATSFDEALDVELSERMSDERRAAFFDDASFQVHPLDTENGEEITAAIGQEVDPHGFYVCGDGTAYGPYDSEDRAYRRAARWSDTSETEYVVEHGHIITEACIATDVEVREPASRDPTEAEEADP